MTDETTLKPDLHDDEPAYGPKPALASTDTMAEPNEQPEDFVQAEPSAVHPEPNGAQPEPSAEDPKAHAEPTHSTSDGPAPAHPESAPQTDPASESEHNPPTLKVEPTAEEHLAHQRNRASQLIQAVRHELRKAVIGQDAAIDDVLTALLAAGHVLIEGVPGLGKTLLVRALARCFAGDFKRIQFTADLMPSDITGHAVFDLQTEQFHLRKGPLFTHLLLADEINRAPARTQAALLEAMQERQVSLEGRSVPIALPFMVLATQNPLEHEGTYPLPEAQLDRFMLKLRMDYPDPEQELAMVRQVTRSARADMLDVQPVRQILPAKDVTTLQRITSELPIDERLLDYAVRLARATRNWPGLSRGAGPRASIALVRGARARALLRGGELVLAEDLKSAALAVLRHRVQLSAELYIEGMEVDQVLRQLLDQVPAPRI